MEPTNHPFRKENDRNQTSMIMELWSMLIFRGVIIIASLPFSCSHHVFLIGSKCQSLRFTPQDKGGTSERFRLVVPLGSRFGKAL